MSRSPRAACHVAVATTGAGDRRFFACFVDSRDERDSQPKKADFVPKDWRRRLHHRCTCGNIDRHHKRSVERTNDACSHNPHSATTTRTGQSRARPQRRQHPLGIKPQQILKEGDQPLAVGMQKAEVASTPESFRQNVLEDQPQEFRARDRPEFRTLGLGVSIPKSHLPVLASEDVFLLDHAAIEIAPEIHQRLLTATDALAVDDPLLRVACRQREPFAGDGLQHLGAKDLGQL